MKKVGRNDLCPCGSGKKYKKCCGKRNVVSLDVLIEDELHEIQLDLFHFSLANYQQVFDDYMEEYLEKNDIPDEIIELFRFFTFTWFITSIELDGKTILQEYIDRKVKTINRQRVKDIILQWRNAKPSVFIVQHQDENQTVTVKNIFSDEIHIVKIIEDEHIVETGGLLLGTILPAGMTSIFFTTFLDMPAGRTEELMDDIMTLYEVNNEKSHARFMSDSFLDILDIFLFGEEVFSLDQFEWKSPMQKLVAENFQEYMEDFEQEETIINMGIFLWYLFCERRNPTIKNPRLFEAALVYLIDKLQPFGMMVTQKELAEEFQVSSSSVSTKYKELEYILSIEIEELQSKFAEIDYDYDEDNLFYEDDNNFVNSRMTLERELLNMEREMAGKDFESFDDANDFLNSRINSHEPSQLELSDKDRAQDLLFDAYEATGSERKQLAKKALKMYPNSPDAYNILAEFEDDPKEQEKLYVKAIKAGESELGQAFFTGNKGHFWGIVSTRPYMRAKFNYGMLLQDIGKLDQAISIYEELLELNPMDNQGVRYELFVIYVEKAKLSEAKALLNQYNEEITANGLYNRVLIDYLEHGRSKKGEKLLKEAIEANPYVMDYLTLKKRLPFAPPDSYGIGDESEAIIYAEQHIDFWRNDPGLIKWLQEF